jgi:hypothetical protein
VQATSATGLSPFGLSLLGKASVWLSASDVQPTRRYITMSVVFGKAKLSVSVKGRPLDLAPEGISQVCVIERFTRQGVVAMPSKSASKNPSRRQTLKPLDSLSGSPSRVRGLLLALPLLQPTVFSFLCLTTVIANADNSAITLTALTASFASTIINWRMVTRIVEKRDL